MVVIYELGPSIKYLFHHAEMNIYLNNLVINLLDYFPLLKLGLVSQLWVFVIIMQNYVTINNLKDHRNYVTTNLLLNHAFNGEIAASAYLNDSIDIITALKLTTNNLNTFELIKSFNKNFNVNKWHFRNIGDILRFNVIRVDSKIYSQAILDNLIIEQNCVRCISGIFNIQHHVEKWTLPFFIKALKTNNSQLLVDKFNTDTRLNLFSAIITENLDLISNVISNHRINLQISYHLALQGNNVDIINYIKNYIIFRMWLEQQVITNGCESLIDYENNVSQTIFRYSRIFYM